MSEIQAANAKFMEAFAKQEPEAVGALYTADCKVMPTGADVVNGPAGKKLDLRLWCLYYCQEKGCPGG